MNNQLLKSIPGIIEKTFPIPARFRSKLPRDIAELSKLLTSNRGDRSLSYLNRPNLLFAYLHYFLPWNLYRLCLLLDSIDISLSNGDYVIDLGSGTLTFVSALWIAKPDLREKELEFFCVDRSGQALEAGKKFFCALGGKWKINLVRQNINITSRRGAAAQRNAKLVCAVNLFNEIYEKVPHNDIDKLKQVAGNAAGFMCKQAGEDAYFLTVEPGVPQSGRFISFLRGAFLGMGYLPAAPCTHSAACPLIENRVKKWCHFAHEDFDPPKELVRLSAAAKLPKERLVYSYILINRGVRGVEKIRVISDAFSLPEKKFGRYGCCERGLVLLRGSKERIEKIDSGSLIRIDSRTFDVKLNLQLDAKSGAVIIEV